MRRGIGKYLSSLTKPEIDNLYEICGFTDEEIKLCEMIRRRNTYIEISYIFSCSTKTIQRRISTIKIKLRKAGVEIE